MMRLQAMFEDSRKRWSALGLRQIKRVMIGIVGGSVLLFGIALVVLPGPAVLVIPAGLAILAIEFEWARRWLPRARGMFRRGAPPKDSGPPRATPP
jgi:Putative transmembrane protein (PGPGW)